MALDTPLDCDIRSGVAWLVLNRPERLNALSTELFVRLNELVAQLVDTPAVRVVVLTGAGRAFSAGGDIKEMDGREPFAILEGSRRQEALAIERRRLAGIHDTMLRFSQLPMPVIAGINGPAAGAGLSLALACDLRIASERATFSTAFGSVGLPGDCGISTLLPEAVGAHRARLLLMRPQRLDAAEALRIGLVDEVVSEARFTSSLETAAQELAAVSPFVHSAVKRRLLPHRALAEGLALELDATLEAQVTHEHREAVRMFTGRPDRGDGARPASASA